jgi:hypothetical protein
MIMRLLVIKQLPIYIFFRTDAVTGKLMARLTMRDPFGKFVWECEVDMADATGLIEAAYRTPAQVKSQNALGFSAPDTSPCPLSDALNGLWSQHREVFDSKLPSKF